MWGFFVFVVGMHAIACRTYIPHKRQEHGNTTQKSTKMSQTSNVENVKGPCHAKITYTIRTRTVIRGERASEGEQ